MKKRDITKIILVAMVLITLTSLSSATANLELTVNCKSSIDMDESDIIYVTLKETGNEHDAVDVVLEVLIKKTGLTEDSKITYPDGTLLKKTSDSYHIKYNIGSIPKGTSRTVSIPIKYGDDLDAGYINIKTGSGYYSSEYMGMSKAGPYDVYKTKSVELKTIYGKAEITTIPSEVGAYMDGKFKGNTPLTIEKITPGEHTFTFKEYGYFDDFITHTIKKGMTTEMEMRMSKNTFDIQISSSPTGANVYIDGRYEGSTPFKETFSAGSYKVKFEKDGYNTITETLTLKKGSYTTKLCPTLTKKSISSSVSSSKASSSTSSSKASASPTSSSSSNSNQSPGFTTSIAAVVVSIAFMMMRTSHFKKR